MQASLTTVEPQIGIGLSILLALGGGLMIAAAARHGVMAVHGSMALALGLRFRLGAVLYDVEPAGPDRAAHYDDGPTRFGCLRPERLRLTLACRRLRGRQQAHLTACAER